MAKKSKKAKSLLTQAINHATAAEAGPGGVEIGSGGPKARLRGTVPAGSGAGDPGTKGKTPLAAGEVAYGGKVYTKANLGSLAKELNKRGVSLAQYAANNKGFTGALGISDKKLSQVISARTLLRRARKSGMGGGLRDF